MKQIRIATRASKLALAQTHQVIGLLRSVAPDVAVSIVEISTKGDRDTSAFLYEVGSIGFFTSEIEKALLDGRADVAVHSLKDLPTTITKGLVLSAIPEREKVSDVIIASGKIASIDDVPNGATVGTSSVRRITQMKLMRPDLDCQPLRGNVETRIRKVQDGAVDAIVIAEAGVNRLGLSDKISLVLGAEEFVPAPGQGALAIQTRRNDVELCALVGKLNDSTAAITTQTERRILAGLHGGCSIPLGVYSHIADDRLHIHAILCNLAATKYIRKKVSCPIDKAMETADIIAREILDEGGRDILDEIQRNKDSQTDNRY